MVMDIKYIQLLKYYNNEDLIISNSLRLIRGVVLVISFIKALKFKYELL